MSMSGKHISPFQVILVMAALMIIGVTMIPLLNVQYSPGVRQKGISVQYSWPGASARIVEQEVTSKVEGALAPISGIQEMYSASYKDGGSVSLSFKKEANMDALRFDISSRIRQLYASLPEGVSYPQLSTGMDGQSASPVLTYTIHADLPTWQIAQYTEQNIAGPLSRIEGVSRVSVTGATPFEWVVTFDPNRCAILGITGGDIRTAFSTLNRNDPVGLGLMAAPGTDDLRQIRIGLKQAPLPPEQWSEVVVKQTGGRIVRLGDIATVEHRQKLPETYYRLNGLNNINLTIYAEKHVNTLVVTDALKAQIAAIEAELPAEYSMTLADDTSVYIRGELRKIYWRTGLSVLILLGFVFLTSRSLRYLWMIVLTVVCNVLVAFIFYNIFGLEIHLYSLAGITVSLGMIIDTSIIMIDHYDRFGNRRVFLAIMGALLTTIGALSIVLFLPENQRDNLVDFCAVIVINLVVSMAISILFIPALLDRFPIHHNRSRRLSRGYRTRGKRRVARVTAAYGRFLERSRRLRWVYIVVALLGFGIPVQMLPPKIEHKEEPKRDSTLWVRAYNATIGSNWYQQKAKTYVEMLLGGSMRLFAKDVYNSDFYSDPERTRLIINASQPEGCTVHQLNETMRVMENFLSGFDEIEMFRTSITSYDNGQISVTFKPEADKAGFAYRLKELATTQALELGGADWSIYGVGQGFSNSLSSGWK
ncbi:efflux RND transporter permease subunit, partial [uncultured Rikenella sp.]|uniref:efflux RND transporter permease subunit n=1 Tax=uncultured Rikenella sp. TaxID=368003 RepID=UPI00260E7951